MQTIKVRLRLAVFLVVFLILPLGLFADTISFSYVGVGVTASGTFTGSPIGGGASLITGISGTQNGDAMTLLPAGSVSNGTFCYGTLSNDNVFYTGTPQPSPSFCSATNPNIFVDSHGIAFAAGGQDYLLWLNCGIFACGGLLNPSG